MNEYLYQRRGTEQRHGVWEVLREGVNVLEMKCLRSLVGVSQMDRVRNERVHRKARIKRELARTDQRVLRWFGYVKRMDEHRMARMVLMAEISGGRVRGRPRLDWMDGVNVALGKRVEFSNWRALGPPLTSAINTRPLTVEAARRKRSEKVESPEAGFSKLRTNCVEVV